MPINNYGALTVCQALYCTIYLYSHYFVPFVQNSPGVGAMIISTHRRGNREARCWRRASPSVAQSLGSHRAMCIYLPNAAWCQPTGQQNGRSEQSSSNCGQEPEGRTCASTITTQRATATLCQRWHQHVINMRSLTSASSPLL